MSDQTNLFTDTTAVVDPQPTPSVQADPFKDLLTGITNEHGQPKYKDIPSALEGLKHAQSFIETLKAEKAEKEAAALRLQAELDKRSSLDEVVQRLASQKSNTEPTVPNGLTEQQVAELIESQLSKQQTKLQQDSNLSTVNKTLHERFGDKASEVLKSKAQELGLSVQTLAELAKSSPQAVLAYFPSTSTAPANKQSLNTSNFQSAPSHGDVPAPSKSLLSGASSKDQAEYMKQIREHIYTKYGVTQ